MGPAEHSTALTVCEAGITAQALLDAGPAGPLGPARRVDAGSADGGAPAGPARSVLTMLHRALPAEAAGSGTGGGEWSRLHSRSPGARPSVLEC